MILFALEGLLPSPLVKRYRSAWIGIAAHSSQSVVFNILVLTVVLQQRLTIRPTGPGRVAASRKRFTRSRLMTPWRCRALGARS